MKLLFVWVTGFGPPSHVINSIPVTGFGATWTSANYSLLSVSGQPRRVRVRVRARVRGRAIVRVRVRVRVRVLVNSCFLIVNYCKLLLIDGKLL